MPSFIRPASLIMFWFHGGSQTSCTSASSTPSMLRILLWASCAIAGPIPQPGAVRVIFHFDFRAAVFFLDETTVVDKAEVDDIYGDFRVVTLSQLVPNRFFIDWPVVFCCGRLLAIRARRLLQAKRFEVFFGDAGQALIGGNCIATAEGLCDHAGRPSRNGRLVAAWDLDRFDVAGSGEFGVFVHKTVSLG